jgi:parallel beta-helix repeat protein
MVGKKLWSRRRALGLLAMLAPVPLLHGCEGRAFSARPAPRSARPVSKGASFGAMVATGYAAQDVSDALNALGAPGGEVVLPAGTYSIDRTLIIPSDRVMLRGEGPDTVLHATSNAFNMIYLENRSNITFRDMTLRGVGQDGIGGAGIVVSQAQQCTFDNLWMESFGSLDAAGLLLQSSSNNRIVNCHFESNGRGCHLYQGSRGNVIDNCSGHNNGKEMVFLTGDCTDNTVSNCVSDGDGSRAPAVSIAFHRSDRSVLTGCTVLGSGHEQGVEIAAGFDYAVMGCTIAGSAWEGLHVVNAQRVTIIGNTISDNMHSGIILRGAGDPEDVRPSDGCVIARNLISGNDRGGKSLNEARWVGISVENANYTVIEDNQLVDNQSAAIYVARSNLGTRIARNQVEGAHALALLDEGSSTDTDITN